MLATVLTGALLGIDGYTVEVQVDVTRGFPYYSIVGLPEGAVRESKDRVKSALRNCGYTFPRGRVTINLAPADIKKTGAGFDLPIAVGLMAGQGLLETDPLARHLVVGELSLDGRLRPVKGVLSLAMAAREAGLEGIVLPAENGPEAAVVSGISVHPAESLPQVIEFFNGDGHIEPLTVDTDELFEHRGKNEQDINDVRGQEQAKRALEVASAGAHNLIMLGPPGSGKTMLAKCLPSILPPLTFEEALETTKVYSSIGETNPESPLQTQRPFRTPHHTISDAGLIGGGAIPRPGEVSLAHFGVLFLDELPEFKKSVLEVLRQPIEDGRVTVARAAMSLTFPARFMLVAAMNPCPCGYLRRPGQGMHLHRSPDPALPVPHFRPAHGPHRPAGRGSGGQLQGPGHRDQWRVFSDHQAKGEKSPAASVHPPGQNRPVRQRPDAEPTFEAVLPVGSAEPKTFRNRHAAPQTVGPGLYPHP